MQKLINHKERKKKIICMMIGVCIGAILTGFVISKRAMEVDERVSSVQKSLSEEVFRFHVLADSDSEEAQEVKLKVRDAVLTYMKEFMPGNEELVSAKQTEQWVRDHLFQIERIARETIQEQGFSYGAKAEVTNCYFPEKRYGDVTFPEGYYEALRIELGEAKGQNWWCALYPNLCFIDATYAVVSEEGKSELQSALTEEEYELVTATTDFKIKSFFFGEKEKLKK